MSKYKELGIIGFLCYIKFFKETYTMTLTCTNTSQSSENNYTICMNDVQPQHVFSVQNARKPHFLKKFYYGETKNETHGYYW